jgi:hypothetical protein
VAKRLTVKGLNLSSKWAKSSAPILQLSESIPLERQSAF